MTEPVRNNSIARLRAARVKPIHTGEELTSSIGVPSRYLALLAIIAATMITRVWYIGDPAIHMDEQFYLLVGERMWQGALPYVDIWDRKPIGLFLIYAALRPFSPTGIVAYQVGAFASVVATALIIRRISQRFASSFGSTVAAILYIFFLPLFGGSGGQSPVFYNLPVALSALFVIRASDTANARDFVRFSCASMLLCGLALQIKYTVLFEGVFFGLWLLFQKWRRGSAFGTLLAFAILLISIALVPTLLVSLFYAFSGHFYEFFYANFLSLFHVKPSSFEIRKNNFIATSLTISPVIVIFLFSLFQEFILKKRKTIYYFVPLWSASAIIGYFSLGNNYNHYALPVLVPLVTLCAPLFKGLNVYIAIITTVIWSSVLNGTSAFHIRPFHEERISAMTAALRPYTDQGCIYINDGPVILYLLTRSCLPTPYLFTEHLNNAGESQATEAPLAMERLLYKRPSVIMVADRPLEHPRNPVTTAMLNRAIAQDYHAIIRLPDIYRSREQIIYVRNDLK